MTFDMFVYRIVFALLFGALLGAEREWRHHVAGMKTNALVTVGAALFVVLADCATHDSSPTRMAAQVVSGVGFLGAGLLMRDGFTVRGINTAATLWCAAAIGVLAGSGLVFYSGVATLLLIGAQFFLHYLSNLSFWQTEDGEPYEIACTIFWKSQAYQPDKSSTRSQIVSLLKKHLGARILSVSVGGEQGEQTTTWRIVVWKKSVDEIEGCCNQISQDVAPIRWEIS